MLVIFIAISIIAILLTRGLKLSDRITEFSKGAGHKDMLLMVWIFILAGAFASSAKAMGAVDATVNLTLKLLPTQFLLAGLFTSSCIVSLCMGTSVGTIVALVPIAATLADKTDMSVALMTASIVSGAFFGDNLSFISDTTIVATQSQGCKPKDKFKFNFFMVLPAAIIVAITYLVMGSSTSEVVIGQVMWWKIIPYAAVLILATCGMNVMIVILIGILLTGVVGIADGSYNFIVWVESLTAGVTGMGELILISMMAGGIFALITYQGVMQRIVDFIKSKVRTRKGAELSICATVALANMATANNTVAILSVGDIAKNIAKRFNIDARRTASLLDTTSCTVQGLIPYGAQLLMASGIASISALDIVPFLFYPMLLGVTVLITIFFPTSIKHINKTLK
ncbi:MAG: Na+/H+ antiporter NhaC family protein [Paludibacteraceae bacterium]|nr:Na+/H+ antiporter NhaC family protein [Paludibacteraceae bacterium]